MATEEALAALVQRIIYPTYTHNYLALQGYSVNHLQQTLTGCHTFALVDHQNLL